MAAALAGCSSKPVQVPPPERPRAQPAPTVASGDDSARAVAVFVQWRRALAEQAMRDGRWSKAIRDWEVVLALHPGDREAQALRARSIDAARIAADAALRLAETARKAGDRETAVRRYLEVLALVPAHAQAADALRAIEADRMRRMRLRPYAKPVVTARRNAPDRQAAKGGGHNEVEHASLLADEGQLDAAIAMLLPLSPEEGGDPKARTLLAALYVRLADRLEKSDRGGAVAALQKSLALRPGDRETQRRLDALRRAPPPVSRP